MSESTRHPQAAAKESRPPAAAQLRQIAVADNSLGELQTGAGNLAIQSFTRGAVPRVGGAGQKLAGIARDRMEAHFGADLGFVRVHTGLESARSAAALNSDAFTVGADIHFAKGKFAPHTEAGRHLLAHELAHSVQQQKGGAAGPAGLTAADGVLAGRMNDPLESEADRVADLTAAAPVRTRKEVAQLSAAPPIHGRPRLQRQGAGGGSSTDPAAPPPPAPNVDIPLIPPEWVKQPGANDILTVVTQGRMVALPAAGSFVVLHPPAVTQGVQPTQPLVSVPTIGKEGMVVVNAGGRVGFQLDAGGEPIVVYPAAMSAIRQSLGITEIGKAAVTHIHDDHVRAFVATVRNNNIRPENLFYPAAFAVNASAPGSTFAAAIRALQADPSLRALGHGPSGQYQAIPTPTGAGFFQYSVRERDAVFDFYGLSDSFRDLQSQRAAGQKQPKADTASLLVRVSFGEAGPKALYLGDLRGADLILFEQAMGTQAYGEMLQGVRVIIGFQHHMGALDTEGDRDGLIQLLQSTYMKTGELDVVVQSADQQSSFKLNRSLMTALTGLGINVHVAKGAQAGQVGTITYDSAGNVKIAGAGETESLAGSADVRAEINRLIRLNEAAETLGRYGRFVKPEFRYTDDVRKARDDLKSAVDDYLESSIRNVKTGSERAQPSLNNPTQQAQALQRMRVVHPIEEKLTPAYLDSVRELNRQGPARETIEKEIEAARTTGRMSEDGINALWEVEPEVARRLVGESNLPRSVQRQTMAELPGQGVPVGGRVMAGFMLAIQVAELVGPIVKSVRESQYADDVKKGLVDIIWWQSKGVFPKMEGVNDRWWPRSNIWTTDASEVQKMLDDDDLDYLVLTDIPETYWDPFTVWTTTHLISYPDWNSFITNSTAIRGTGSNVEELTWSYRTGSIKGTTFGFKMDEQWVESKRLTTIMRAAAKSMVETTSQQIAGIAKHVGPDSGPAFHAANKYTTHEAFGSKPQASGKKRFKQVGKEPTLYTLCDQQERTGYDKDDAFYVFAADAAQEDVPAGYVVVGGADYNTYIQIYNTRNRVTERETDEWGMAHWYSVALFPNYRELLLAKATDLEDAP
ncbi:MAG TPA: DUF4157 domain-containing protein [Steroidobacteraceae bacterium]|nr:DUF4157 domain-containing protein [Steroidobacteraceae bacterium]